MIADIESDIGKEYQIPSNPKNIGKINTKGIRNIPCLVKVNSKAGKALPMA